MVRPTPFFKFYFRRTYLPFKGVDTVANGHVFFRTDETAASGTAGTMDARVRVGQIGRWAEVKSVNATTTVTGRRRCIQ
jgi:hypothetical protein